jgi:DNA-binding winged helix-turn-helix (wHTH) protein/TolB-like protein/Tfp pilus assembly protein PilF
LKSAVDPQEPHIYAFGDFRLDVSKRLLRRGGAPVSLTPKVFDTLVYLVEHNGKVLSKDDLMSAVWPDTVVEENNLGQNISKLRAVLGESPGHHRWIVTQPGRGYRFVADVRLLASGMESSPADAGLPGLVPEQNPSVTAALSLTKQATSGFSVRLGRFVFAGLLAGLLVVGVVYFLRSRNSASAHPTVESIAVLPFKPLLPESRDEALELGMADTLITKLCNGTKIIVRPISSVRRYGGVEQDPLAAGRELVVDAVLDGTIQRWGDRIRVTARLVRVSDNKTLWANQFDRGFGDIFDVQDSISEQAAAELVPILTGEEKELLARRYTSDTEAYEFYLKGRFFWYKRTPQATAKAAEYFQRALERDPRYALAYAGIADCYRTLPIMSDAPSRESFPKAKQAALKALEIDNNLAEAHSALGYIEYFFEWDWAAAEKEFQRAIEINPNHPLAYLGYAHLLSTLGRDEDALAEIDRAIKLDPLSPFVGTIKGQILFHAGRYSEAIEEVDKALEIEPNFWIGQIVLCRSYERLAHYEQALKACRMAAESSGDVTEATSLAGYVYAVSGQRQQAEQALRALRATSETRYVPPYNFALVYQGLGNSNEALRWLEKAYEQRDVHMVFLPVDSKWDALRKDPQFMDLITHLNLPIVNRSSH